MNKTSWTYSTPGDKRLLLDENEIMHVCLPVESGGLCEGGARSRRSWPHWPGPLDQLPSAYRSISS